MSVFCPQIIFPDSAAVETAADMAADTTATFSDSLAPSPRIYVPRIIGMPIDSTMLADRDLSESVVLPHELDHSGFFSRDSLISAVPDSRGIYGVVGTPIGYQVRTDDMFTALILACFVVFIVALSRSRQFFAHSIRNFFSPAKAERDETTETGNEMRLQIFLSLLCCMLLAFGSYFVATTYITKTFRVADDYMFILLMFGFFAASFALKFLLVTVVNATLFTGKKSLQYLHSLLFITSAEGVLLYPVVLLQVFFELKVEKAIYYYVFLFAVIKILTFCKSQSIFFRQKGSFFQNFLYFCALEAVPMLIAAAVWLRVVDTLKVIS